MKSKFSQLIVVAFLLCLVFTSACVSSDPCQKAYEACVKKCGTGQASGMCKGGCADLRAQCHEEMGNMQGKKSELEETAMKKFGG